MIYSSIFSDFYSEMNSLFNVFFMLFFLFPSRFHVVSTFPSSSRLVPLFYRLLLSLLVSSCLLHPDSSLIRKLAHTPTFSILTLSRTLSYYLALTFSHSLALPRINPTHSLPLALPRCHFLTLPRSRTPSRPLPFSFALIFSATLPGFVEVL